MKSDCLRNTCPCETCTELREIQDMVIRRNPDALAKKVKDLHRRLSQEAFEKEYLSSILEGSYPDAVTLLEDALESAKLKNIGRIEYLKDRLLSSYIIVNGKEYEIKGEGLVSYSDIAGLANLEWVNRNANPEGVNRNALSIITYSKGHPDNPEGVLFNKAVRLKHGMIFNVADTSNA